jgi:hypothetical protein
MFLNLYNIINNKNFESLEELRETMIADIYFNSKTNNFEFRRKDIVKLLKIIRKIDWDFYIIKFSLLKDDPLVIKYKKFLETIIDLTVKDYMFVAENIIISKTYRKKFIDSIENDDLTKAYKILIITLAEWTDTTVFKKIAELSNYKLPL